MQSMYNDITIQETLKLGQKNIGLNIFTITGKDGDFYVTISPTLNISGYGMSEIEAKESFHENVKQFARDLFDMSSSKRERYIYSLGFRKAPHSNKNFSKAYVDNNGVLNGFDENKAERKMFSSQI